MQLPPFLLDRFVRRKAKFSEIDLDRFDIRIARTHAEYENAFRLLHVGYVFQGYEPVRELDLRMTEQHLLQEATVLVAYEKERMVGTVSVTGDSLAGLPLDKDYPAELMQLRRQAARIAEVNSLAVVRNRWRSGLSQLLGLAAGRLTCRILESTHRVIGVDPRVMPLYRAIYGYQPLGPIRRHGDLDADVWGLVQEIDASTAHVRKHFSTFPCGLPVAEYALGAATPPGLTMPEDISGLDWPRWKMPRAVFRNLVRNRERLGGIGESTRTLIRRQRSDETLGIKRKDAAA